MPSQRSSGPSWRRTRSSRPRPRVSEQLGQPGPEARLERRAADVEVACPGPQVGRDVLGRQRADGAQRGQDRPVVTARQDHRRARRHRRVHAARRSRPRRVPARRDSTSRPARRRPRRRRTRSARPSRAAPHAMIDDEPPMVSRISRTSVSTWPNTGDRVGIDDQDVRVDVARHEQIGMPRLPPARCYHRPRDIRTSGRPTVARRTEGADRWSVIVLVGAGSVEFTRNLLGDFLAYPELRDATHRAPRHRSRPAADGTSGWPHGRPARWAPSPASRPTWIDATRCAARTSWSTPSRSAAPRRPRSTSTSPPGTASATPSTTPSTWVA